jgi:hypothetical protein
MNEPRLCGRLLTRLFRNGQAGETTDIISLARSCGSDVLAVLRAMAALERSGLADARRLRLTLSGLALAAAFSEPESSESQPKERRPGRSLSEGSPPALTRGNSARGSLPVSKPKHAA